MKTTNYELSKRLAEIGFKAHDFERMAFDFGTLGFKDSLILMSNTKNEGFPSYDLETLLHFFPRCIVQARGKYDNIIKYFHCDKIERGEWECEETEYHFEISFDYIGYGNDSIGHHFCKGNKIIFREHLENWDVVHESKSIVDAAAKLLILLYDIGIVKFGGENE